MTLDANTCLLTSSDGCHIYADAVGDPSKPCLVFIHGFTLSGAVFDNIFFDARCSSEFFLVRYDVRGHGRSGKPNAADQYSSKLYADDFSAVLDAFNLHRPIVVAWSLGATVVADVAAHLPDDTISGIVYLAPCPYIGPVMQAIGTPFILDLLSEIATTDDATKANEHMQTFFNSCFTDPNAIEWETRALWQGMSTFQKPSHRRFVLSRAQDPARLLDLGAKGLPVLTLIGSKDPQIVASLLQNELRRIFSNLEFIILDGAGHSIHYENKQEVMSQIRIFSRKLHVKKNEWDSGSRIRKAQVSFMLRYSFVPPLLTLVFLYIVSPLFHPLTVTLS